MNSLREEMRDIISENPPSIAEDSGQPEYNLGETDKVIAKILSLIRKRLPKEELHSHNSIPNYYDGLEDGCRLCVKNQRLKKVREILE